MKTTLVIILIAISVIFGVNGAIKAWKEIKTGDEPMWKKLRFVLLDFIIEAIIWPIIVIVRGWNWLKRRPYLKILIGGIVLGVICYAILYFGCLFSGIGPK